MTESYCRSGLNLKEHRLRMETCRVPLHENWLKKTDIYMSGQSKEGSSRKIGKENLDVSYSSTGTNYSNHFKKFTLRSRHSISSSPSVYPRTKTSNLATRTYQTIVLVVGCTSLLGGISLGRATVCSTWYDPGSTGHWTDTFELRLSDSIDHGEEKRSLSLRTLPRRHRTSFGES